MRLRPEVRVGLIVFIAFVALIATYLFLGGLGLRTQTYPLYATFQNVQTVEKGTDVRMAGVKIGLVQDIVLTPQTRARVVMRIYDRFKVPRGSIARISTAGVIGNYYVEIVPTQSRAYVKPGTTLKSVEVTTLNDLLAQASGLMEGLTGLTDDLKVTTSGLNKILGDEQIAEAVKATALNLQQASASGLQLANRLNAVVEGATPDIQQTINRVSVASERLLTISEDFAITARGLRTGLVEGGGFSRMQDILANAQRASANLATATESLTALTGDEQFVENIKVTAEQARIAATQAAELATRINRLTGRLKKTEPEQKTTVPTKGLTLDTYYNSGTDSLGGELNYSFSLLDPNRFYQVGVIDEEKTKVNLMIGQPLGINSSIRYGLYASSLGIGYDRRVADRLWFQSNLYDLDDINLRIKGFYEINPNWNFLLGTNDLLDDPDLLVGVQYRK